MSTLPTRPSNASPIVIYSDGMDPIYQPATGITRIQFEGEDLDVVVRADGVFVSTRRVCDVLGIAFAAQRMKLKRASWAVVSMIDTTGLDGKRYEMHTIALKSLPLWLGTINENKVAKHIRPKLIKYQQDCADVLYRHFFGSLEPKTQVVIEKAPKAATEPRLVAKEARLRAQLELRIRKNDQEYALKEANLRITLAGVHQRNAELQLQMGHTRLARESTRRATELLVSANKQIPPV